MQSHYLYYIFFKIHVRKRAEKGLLLEGWYEVSIFSHWNSWHHQKDLRPHWFTRVTAYANRSADQLNTAVGLYRDCHEKNRLIDRSSKSASHLETLNCLLDETLQSNFFFFCSQLSYKSFPLILSRFISLLFQYLNIREARKMMNTRITFL